MSYHQSKHVAGYTPVHFSALAGVVQKTVFKYTMETDVVAASEYLEIGVLPADTQLLGVTVIGDGLGGAVTATVGTLDGDVGSKSARTIQDTLIAAADINGNELSANMLDCINLARSGSNTAIGVTVSADVTGAAGKDVYVVLEYTT